MSKIKDSGFVGSIGRAAMAGVMTAHLSPPYRQMVEAQTVWEVRQNEWQAKWGGDDSHDRLYKELGEKAQAQGYSNLTSVQPWFIAYNRPRLTLKMIAERIVGHRLPDISPKACWEFAKETPYSAENWYQGCTG